MKQFFLDGHPDMPKVKTRCQNLALRAISVILLMLILAPRFNGVSNKLYLIRGRPNDLQEISLGSWDTKRTA